MKIGTKKAIVARDSHIFFLHRRNAAFPKHPNENRNFYPGIFLSIG
jgi:hypothetical protein